MRNTILLSLICLAATVSQSQAVEIYTSPTVDAIDAAGTDIPSILGGGDATINDQAPAMIGGDIANTSLNWASDTGVIDDNAAIDGYFTFNFGTPTLITELHIWNYNMNAGASENGIREFDLQFSSDSTNGFDGTWTDSGLGTSTAIRASLLGGGIIPNEAQEFDFTDATTTWARVAVRNTFTGNARLAVQDIQFTTALPSAPEPSTLLLAAISVAGLGFVRRRRRR